MSLAAQISLGPTASEVRRLNNWLDEKFTESGISQSLAADLKLCLNEIIANLIAYGFKDTQDPFTSLEIELQPQRASATVVDNGSYFDIRAWEPPAGRNLATAEPGGFGVALIKERATHIAYERKGYFNCLSIVCEAASR